MLGQAVATTSPLSIYSPAASTESVIKLITVCNTSINVVTISIYRDDNGTTYDLTTAVNYQQSLAAKSTAYFNVYYCMNNSSGNIAIEAGSSNSITITLDGIEFT